MTGSETIWDGKREQISQCSERGARYVLVLYVLWDVCLNSVTLPIWSWCLCHARSSASRCLNNYISRHCRCPSDSRHFKAFSVNEMHTTFKLFSRRHLTLFRFACRHSLLLSRTANCLCLCLICTNPYVRSNVLICYFIWSSKSSVSTQGSYAAMAALAGYDKDLDFTSHYTLLIPQQKVHLQKTATAGKHIKDRIILADSRASIDRMWDIRHAYLSICTRVYDLAIAHTPYNIQHAAGTLPGTCYRGHSAFAAFSQSLINLLNPLFFLFVFYESEQL